MSSRRKSVVFSIKLNPSKAWDRDILKWLESIPSGARGTLLKYYLWQAITQGAQAGTKPPAKADAACLEVERKIDQLEF